MLMYRVKIIRYKHLCKYICDSYRIKINGSDKNFIFSAVNKDDNKIWAEKLIDITNRSLGRQYNLIYLSKYHRFWRKEYFS